MAALEGDLRSFSVVDVVTMLAAAHKTGRLSVFGAWDGWLQFHDGDVADGAALGDTEPAVVTFHLMRLAEGAFSFEPTPHAIPVRPPIELATLVEGVEEVERAWREIEVVLPSRQVGLRLAPSLGRTSITLTPEQWAALVAIVDVGWLGGLSARLGWGEFGCARTVKDLVDIGAVVVGAEIPSDGDPPAPRPGAPAPAPIALDDDGSRVAEGDTVGAPPRPELSPVRSLGGSARPATGGETDGARHAAHPAEAETTAERFDSSPRAVSTLLAVSPVLRPTVDPGPPAEGALSSPHQLAEVAPPPILVVPPLPPDPELDREPAVDLGEVTVVVTDRGDPDEPAEAIGSLPAHVAGREPLLPADETPDAERSPLIEDDLNDTDEDDISDAAPIAGPGGADVDRSALLRELRSL